MRILSLAHIAPYPADNGAKLRILNMTRQLAQRHEVQLLCPPMPRDAVQAMQSVLGGRATVGSVAWPLAGVQRGARGYLSALPRDVLRAADEPAVRLVAQQVEQFAPDVIIASDPVLGEYLRPFASAMRVIDIAAEYTLYIRRVMRYAPRAQRLLWRMRLHKWAAYTRSLGHAVDLWIVPAPYDRASLRALLPSDVPVGVIPNGFDTALHRFTPNADAPPQIAHCGALSYAPNRDGLTWFCAEAWPAVRARQPDLRLLITGDSAGAPPVIRNAPGVTLTGHLPSVRPVLTASRAAIVPLRIGVGTRLKILEAMATGTPVVATNVGAEGLDVVDGEHLLLADTPAQFAAQLVRVVESRELRQHLVGAARQLVEQRYDWAVIGDELHALLETNAAHARPATATRHHRAVA